MLALIGGLAACGSPAAGSGGSGGGSRNSPYVQGVAFDNRGDIAAILGVQVLDEWLTYNNPYGMSTKSGAQWALGAEVGYEQHELIGNPGTNPSDGTKVTSAVVNPTTLTVSSDGIVFQAVLTFSDGTTSGTVIVTDPLTGWINGSDGYSWTPVTTAAPAPANSAQAPATQAAPPPVSSAAATAPAPATSAPAPAPTPTWTVFGCSINGTFSQPIGPSSSFTVTNTSGSAVATVVDIAVSGNGVQTDTVKAPSENRPGRSRHRASRAHPMAR